MALLRGAQVPSLNAWCNIVLESKVACSSRIYDLQEAIRRDEYEIDFLTKKVDAHDKILSEFRHRFPTMEIPPDLKEGILTGAEIHKFRMANLVPSSRPKHCSASTPVRRR